MKAKELIEALQKLDPETLVLVNGYEADYDTPKEAVEIIVCEQHTEWYYGDYQICQKEDAAAIEGVLLSRRKSNF
jgi:hypothetical protein